MLTWPMQGAGIGSPWRGEVNVGLYSYTEVSGLVELARGVE